MPPKISLPGVKHVIAVASGKGGVGKSTVAANLAMALHMHGRKVGLMDADIYGPSRADHVRPRHRRPAEDAVPAREVRPQAHEHGLPRRPEQAVIWRGPKVAQAVQAFLGQIDWGELDYLVIDLPPGTGDAQLTLTQSAPLTGAVIVTTPQDVSLIDARKGVEMFREVRVPVLGIVENMSYFEDATGNEDADLRRRRRAEAGRSRRRAVPGRAADRPARGRVRRRRRADRAEVPRFAGREGVRRRWPRPWPKRLARRRAGAAGSAVVRFVVN